MSAGRLRPHRQRIIEAINLGRPLPEELREPLARLIDLHLTLAERFPADLAKLVKRAEGRHG